MQRPGGPFRAVFAASVLTKGPSKMKSDKKRSGKPGQPSEVPTKEAPFGGKCFNCDQDGHRAKECLNAEAVKEIIDDRAQDRRNILALTSQTSGPGTVRKSIYVIRQVQANRKERETIARATSSRVRDKKAGVSTNLGDIILAFNRRINNGFNFNEYWVILDSGALFHNAKLLKNLCEKTHNTHIVGISDKVIEITHEGHFCDNLRADWHPDVPVNVV